MKVKYIILPILSAILLLNLTFNLYELGGEEDIPKPTENLKF